MISVAAWLRRHAVLTAWAVIAFTIASIAFIRGEHPVAAIGTGASLGALFVLLPFVFDPVPLPLSRDQLPMRLPVLRSLSSRRHWANPFYVEVLTLRSAWRPSYCAEQLSAALLKFPWLPYRTGHNIAGRVRGDRFTLKRLTLWADGMRPTASGRLEDAHPGTRLIVWIAAPAVGAYFFLVLLVAFGFGFLLMLYAVVTTAAKSGVPPTDIALFVLAGLLATFALTALFASPLPLPIGRSITEADRYVAFFGDVLGADVLARE